jgi:hypothetical protein
MLKIQKFNFYQIEANLVVGIPSSESRCLSGSLGEVLLHVLLPQRVHFLVILLKPEG